MINYFHRRFERLVKRCDLPENTQTIDGLQSLMGLGAPALASGTYSISLTKHESFCILHIHYTHTAGFDLNTYNIIALPPDINNYIAEYLPSYITLSIRIDYMPPYPFSPPVWGLVACDDRLMSSLPNAEEYYKYIITNHNNMNNTSWSPAIEISSDILQFITRIHHFDSLFLSR